MLHCLKTLFEDIYFTLCVTIVWRNCVKTKKQMHVFFVQNICVNKIVWLDILKIFSFYNCLDSSKNLWNDLFKNKNIVPLKTIPQATLQVANEICMLLQNYDCWPVDVKIPITMLCSMRPAPDARLPFSRTPPSTIACLEELSQDE